MASITTFAAAALAPPPVSAHRRRPTSVSAASTCPSNWWSPIFGWSSEPDYVDGEGEKKLSAEARPKLAPGGFTEEKARMLRMRLKESENFHDVMYHSAIASRLASDLSDRRRG